MQGNILINLSQQLDFDNKTYNTEADMQILCSEINRYDFRNIYSYCHVNDLDNYHQNILCIGINCELFNSNYRIIINKIKDTINF